MYCNINERIKNIADKKYKDFLCKANVIGVGFGYKVIKNIDTHRPCIKVLVTKKVPISILDVINLIPREYEGISTDVIEVGVVKANSLTGRVRPVTGGYSIGPAFFNNISGSYGCMVRDDNNFYILSCNHIIAAENLAPINTPVLQPSLLDGGRGPTDIVARLSKFIPLAFKTPRQTPENLVDCAIARISNLNLVSNSITFMGVPSGIDTVIINEFVEKIGSTTERTVGYVQSLNTTLTLDYGQGKDILFKNLIITSKMSESGDSGAVLLNFGNRVVGLVIASSTASITNPVTVANPIQDVLSMLNVRLAIDYR